LPLARPLLSRTAVTLRIETESGEDTRTLRLSGRIDTEALPQLHAQIRSRGSGVVLDLFEVTLVDAGVVRFLNACETEGIELRGCAAYIREWMRREQSRATSTGLQGG
jgi:ABC-type transporter Mla MlaB component